MAEQTTIYDVITRYRVEDGASNPTDKVTRGADRAGKSFGIAQNRVAVFGTQLRQLTRFLGPLAGIGGVAFAAHKTFAGLNEQLEKSVQLAAQFNLAFKYDADPGRQFIASLRESRGLVQDIIIAAKELPGESADFFQIASLSASPLFAAGGKRGDLLELTKRVALFSPLAGIDYGTAAMQSQSILMGVARRNMRLFSLLFSTGGPEGMTPEQLKTLPAAERLERFNRALGRFTDNPLFRGEIDRLYSTQFGTLNDLLFGPAGIGGQLATGAFENFRDSLYDLNQSITENMPEIVGGLSALGSTVNLAAMPFKAMGMLFGSGLELLTGHGLDELGRRRAQVGTARRLAGAAGLPFLEHGPVVLQATREIATYLAGLKRLSDTGLVNGSDIERAVALTMRSPYGLTSGPLTAGDLIRRLDANLQKAEETRTEGEPRTPGGDVINQTFNVKIDLKSDDSPEAIAVKFRKAMEKADRAPTRSRRGLPANVGPSAI